MYRRQSSAWIPDYEPERCLKEATLRRCSVPVLLPWQSTPEVRAVPGAASTRWQDRKAQRLSSLSLGTPHELGDRGTRRELLLPPLRQTSGARGAKARRTRQPATWDDPDTLGGLLGDLLPSKFRDFLNKLHTKSAELDAHSEPAGAGAGEESGVPCERESVIPSSLGFSPPPHSPFIPLLLASQHPQGHSTLGAH